MYKKCRNCCHPRTTPQKSSEEHQVEGGSQRGIDQNSSNQLIDALLNMFSHFPFLRKLLISPLVRPRLSDLALHDLL